MESYVIDSWLFCQGFRNKISLFTVLKESCGFSCGHDKKYAANWDIVKTISNLKWV